MAAAQRPNARRMKLAIRIKCRLTVELRGAHADVSALQFISHVESSFSKVDTLKLVNTALELDR